MIFIAIKIRKLENTGTKLIGLADLSFDDMFVLHEIKILSNKGEMFLAMPSRKKIQGLRILFTLLVQNQEIRLKKFCMSYMKLYSKVKI